MDCKELADLLSDKVLAELTSHERAVVAAHVAECSACKQEWGLDQESQDLHVAAGILDTHNSVKDAVMARINGGDAVPERQGGPKKLDGYELLGKLGRGGMGVVYKARQISVDRIVAVKILPQRLSRNEVYLERFFREARSAAKMNHSNIVQAFDAGFDRGYHYFVMEYIDGPTVADRLVSDGALSEREALTITRGVVAALVHAEQYGIVHRDIKPENIMLTSSGVVKVTDLGLAKSTVADNSITLEGHTIGTPYYMSPEQARGEKHLDTRSDIYSLGATLFRMVTGTVPFGGETPAVVLAKRLTEPTPSPQERRPGLSNAISSLILRMMAKDANRRTCSARELLADIDTILAGKTPPSEAPTRVSRPRSRRRVSPKAPSRVPIYIGVGLALLLLLVIGVTMNQSSGPSPEERAAAEIDKIKHSKDLAARKAWQDIEHYAEAQITATRAERLLAMIDDFDNKHRETGTWETARGKLDELRTAEEMLAQGLLKPESNQACQAGAERFRDCANELACDLDAIVRGTSHTQRL